MVQGDSDTEYTTISVRPEVRNRLRAAKRGGESYTELFNRMLDQYDPPEPEAVADGGQPDG